jgi:hypothetical protein
MDAIPIYKYLIYGTRVAVTYSLIYACILAPIFKITMDAMGHEHVKLLRAFIITFLLMFIARTIMVYSMLIGLRYHLFIWDVSSFTGELIYLLIVGVIWYVANRNIFRSDEKIQGVGAHLVSTSSILVSLFIIFLFLLPLR